MREHLRPATPKRSMTFRFPFRMLSCSAARALFFLSFSGETKGISSWLSPPWYKQKCSKCNIAYTFSKLYSNTVHMTCLHSVSSVMQTIPPACRIQHGKAVAQTCWCQELLQVAENGERWSPWPVYFQFVDLRPNFENAKELLIDAVNHIKYMNSFLSFTLNTCKFSIHFLSLYQKLHSHLYHKKVADRGQPTFLIYVPPISWSKICVLVCLGAWVLFTS